MTGGKPDWFTIIDHWFTVIGMALGSTALVVVYIVIMAAAS
jgi:hypothetical protein